MTEEDKIYLHSLSLYELLELFSDAVKCKHYCPMECRCFESWGREFSADDLKDFIYINYGKRC